MMSVCSRLLVISQPTVISSFGSVILNSSCFIKRRFLSNKVNVDGELNSNDQLKMKLQHALTNNDISGFAHCLKYQIISSRFVASTDLCFSLNSMLTSEQISKLDAKNLCGIVSTLGTLATKSKNSDIDILRGICLDSVSRLTSFDNILSDELSICFRGFAECRLTWSDFSSLQRSDILKMLSKLSLKLETRDLKVDWMRDIPGEIEAELIKNITFNSEKYNLQTRKDSIYLLGQLGFDINSTDNITRDTLFENAQVSLSGVCEPFEEKYLSLCISYTLMGLEKIGVTFDTASDALKLSIIDCVENNLEIMNGSDFANSIGA